MWHFAGCEVHEWPDGGAGGNGYLETRWPDGAKCGADRDSQMQNIDYARHLGYFTVRDALREHELAHTYISEKLGFPYSPTLRAVAEGYGPGTAPYERQLWEEAVVLDFQRYMQTGQIGPALSPYAWRVPGWAADFRMRFTPPPPAASLAA